MSRRTIDYGIDLGTEHSSIALLRGTEVESFKNNEGFEYTPSAVYIDKKNRVWVGQRAKQETKLDPDNAFCEFRKQMGTSKEYRFARSGRVMKPEELSAEVLKSLKADVRQRNGEDIQAAVITVPVDFELCQCEATQKAAQLAGFSLSPLLLEPVAAATAYGFQSQSDKVFWLVYDFGGGTFDAAVIQVRDGVIQVVNHGGDNHLGGKLLDWEIVDQLLVPEVNRRYNLPDFRRGNLRWQREFAKLKFAAEEAKIKVSRMDSADIVVHAFCEGGNTPDFEFELRRLDVERLAEPFILRSINICKKVLRERNLGTSDVGKLVLVGDPSVTVMPYLKERLADPKQGLGIPLEFGVDPVAVKARGAAIFAGVQPLEGYTPRLAKEQYAVDLDYKPVGSDTEPLVGGRVRASGSDGLTGFTIEFINEQARPQWRSGKVGLSPDGGFVANLWAQKGQPNTFLIQLCDATGTICSAAPDRFTYTIGIVPTGPPLTHSIGIALPNNEVMLFLEKGTPLPARKRITLRTERDVRRGTGAYLIQVPVIEGENVKRADRNRLIGSLAVPADRLRQDVPAGSEIEITIEIDERRLVRIRAYIPALDEEIETELKLHKEVANPETLRREADQAKKRLARLRERAQTTTDPAAREALGRIDRQRMTDDVDVSLEASQGDRYAADKCEKRLLDLNVAVDELEDALEWPNLLQRAEETLAEAKKLIQEFGNAADKQNVTTLEREMHQATQSHDSDLLGVKIAELAALCSRISRERPATYVLGLTYGPAGSRGEIALDGRIAEGRSEDTSGFTVEFIRNVAGAVWRSGGSAVGRDGTFKAQLQVVDGVVNAFEIQLRNNKGVICPTQPPMLTYRAPARVRPVLSYLIGASLPDNKVLVCFQKGSALPATFQLLYTMSQPIQRNSKTDFIHTAILEGNNAKRADRNRVIGSVVVSGGQLLGDLAAGAKVQVTLEMTEARALSASAYISSLNQKIDGIFSFQKPPFALEVLKKQVNDAWEHSQKLKRRAQAVHDQTTQQTLGRIEGNIADLLKPLRESSDKQNASDQSVMQLFDLWTALDDVETAICVAEESQLFLDGVDLLHGKGRGGN